MTANPAQTDDPAGISDLPPKEATQVAGLGQSGGTEGQMASQPDAPLVEEVLAEDGATGGATEKRNTRPTKLPGHLADYELKNPPPGRAGNQVLEEPQDTNIRQIQDATQETEETLDSNLQPDLAHEPGGSSDQKILEKQRQIDQIDLQLKAIATKVGQFDKTGIVELFQVLKNEITSVADILDHFDISDLD